MTDGSYGIQMGLVGNTVWLPMADGRMPLEWRPQSENIAMMAWNLAFALSEAGKLGDLKPIDLRKAEQDAMTEENENDVTYTNYISTCWEQFLVPYLGANNTFAQVREVLRITSE